MKYLLIIAATLFSFSFLFQSCQQNEDLVLAQEASNLSNRSEEPNLSNRSVFFKANMAIFDARIRSINKKGYVRELYLPNFSDKNWDKDGIGFKNELFRDNGEGFDLVASDGIFTSINTFTHNEKIPFLKDTELRSVLSHPIVSPDFTKHDELSNLERGYNLRQGQVQSRIFEITCDVELVDCPNTSWYNTSLFGEPCVSISNCSVTVGF